MGPRKRAALKNLMVAKPSPPDFRPPIFQSDGPQQIHHRAICIEGGANMPASTSTVIGNYPCATANAGSNAISIPSVLQINWNASKASLSDT